MPKPVHLRTITLTPCRRPAGKVKVQLGPKKDPTDCFKGRAEWLLEALGAYYSHRAGHCLTPERAKVFVLLYKAGFGASRRLMRYWKFMERDKTPYTFTRGNGPELTLKQALTEASRKTNG